MAIKINVSKSDQENLNEFLVSCGYTTQKRKFHCTLGFIERMIPDDETEIFGQKMIHLLQTYLEPMALIYEVEKASHLFGHVIAFEPTPQSRLQLEDINLWLYNKVKEISEERWVLNEETRPGKLIPHMTLYRARKTDERFIKLEQRARTHPRYSLTQASYVIF